MATRRGPRGRKRRTGGFIKKLPPATKRGGGNKGPGQVKVRGYTRRGSGKVPTKVAVRAYVRAGGGRSVGGGGAARSRPRSRGTATIGLPTYGGPPPKLKHTSKGRARRGTATIGRPKFGPITTDPSWGDGGAKRKRQFRARKAKHAVARRSGGKTW
jgi:hypothetical protein